MEKRTQQLTATGTPIPRSQCARCGYLPDAATSPLHLERRPRVYDLSVCWQCGQIAFYDEQFRLQPLPDEDFSLLPVEARAELRKLVDYVLKRRNEDLQRK